MPWLPDIEALLPLWPWLLLILAAEFVQRLDDAPNAIATVVSTRGIPPGRGHGGRAQRRGAFAGTAVASTIGQGILRAEAIDISTVGAAMIGIVFWSTVAWYFGLPTSESHGLVAGLAGAGLAVAGPLRPARRGVAQGARRAGTLHRVRPRGGDRPDDQHLLAVPAQPARPRAAVVRAAAGRLRRADGVQPW